VRCEVDNAVFFTQKYSTELSKPKVPVLLRTNQESRAEALKHYKLEFRTHMALQTGTTVILAARIYINYASDVLVPRGNWNVISFSNFYDRVTNAGLAHLAMDTAGCFWAENLKDYCTHGNWPFNGLKELMLYDSHGETFWKGSEYLDKFRRRYKGGPKLLELEGLEGEKSEDIQLVEKYLLTTFDKIEGKEEKTKDPMEDRILPKKTIPRFLDDCPLTEPEELRRPNITYRKLVAKSAKITIDC
jgi:2EXR family